MSGTLFVVATPIGNLEDITARALRVLREVALIAAEDTRRTAHLLARYDIKTPATSLHAHNETQKSDAIVARLMRGEHVALVSDAGTPTISDPGRHLVGAAHRAGIRVEPVPGPSAVISALAASGFPSDAFSFFGFPPTRSKARAEWFAKLRAFGGSVVFFEAPHRIRTTLRDLEQAVGDCEVAVCRELTKMHEELVIGPISTVLPRLPKPIGEFTVVTRIGQTTDNASTGAAAKPSIIAYFGELTNTMGFTRKRAVATLAKRYGLRPNEIKKILHERAVSVE